MKWRKYDWGGGARIIKLGISFPRAHERSIIDEGVEAGVLGITYASLYFLGAASRRHRLRLYVCQRVDFEELSCDPPIIVDVLGAGWRKNERMRKVRLGHARRNGPPYGPPRAKIAAFRLPYLNCH